MKSASEIYKSKHYFKYYIGLFVDIDKYLF